ncbi:hypothetical protein EIP91_005158 [Steccherinum ochraceum]|uniref:Uncharacterized protein n=1 Tax=Steccherinum ochraceum TaxID=92696 RepID=A0A4R0R7K6_9APHY|nr:hypothetical protein EIP91_005158 [Steccherinum ochraceum]
MNPYRHSIPSPSLEDVPYLQAQHHPPAAGRRNTPYELQPFPLSAPWSDVAPSHPHFMAAVNTSTFNADASGVHVNPNNPYFHPMRYSGTYGHPPPIDHLDPHANANILPHPSNFVESLGGDIEPVAFTPSSSSGARSGEHHNGPEMTTRKLRGTRIMLPQVFFPNEPPSSAERKGSKKTASAKNHSQEAAPKATRKRKRDVRKSYSEATLRLLSDAKEIGEDPDVKSYLLLFVLREASIKHWRNEPKFHISPHLEEALQQTGATGQSIRDFLLDVSRNHFFRTHASTPEPHPSMANPEPGPSTLPARGSRSHQSLPP